MDFAFRIMVWTIQFLYLDCELSLSSFRRGNNIALTRFVHEGTLNNSKGETVSLVAKICSLVVELTVAIVPTQMNILAMAIKSNFRMWR